MANFTQKHLEELKNLVFEAVTKNILIAGKLGQNYTVLDLFMNCSFNTLRALKKQYTTSISSLPDDEWTEKSLISQDQADYLTNCLNLINLTLGYKIDQAEKAEVERKKATLQERIDAIKESTKTPEEKLKELETELNNL